MSDYYWLDTIFCRDFIQSLLGSWRWPKETGMPSEVRISNKKEVSTFPKIQYGCHVLKTNWWCNKPFYFCTSSLLFMLLINAQCLYLNKFHNLFLAHMAICNSHELWHTTKTNLPQHCWNIVWFDFIPNFEPQRLMQHSIRSTQLFGFICLSLVKHFEIKNLWKEKKNIYLKNKTVLHWFRSKLQWICFNISLLT